MTSYDYIKFLAALLFVLGMMGGLFLILRRFSVGGMSIKPNDKRRLKVIETLYLDARKKAVLIKRDDVEHLVILGANSETVVETNIKAEKTHD